MRTADGPHECSGQEDSLERRPEAAVRVAASEGRGHPRLSLTRASSAPRPTPSTGRMGDPGFWGDPAAAQKILQRRKRLDTDLELLKRLRGQEDDANVLADWLESGEDVAADFTAALDALEATAEAAEFQKMLGGDHDRANAILDDQRRGRRHRQPGLGRDAPAHVPALVRPPRLQARHHRHPGGGGGGDQERHRDGAGRVRLRLPRGGSGRPPPGAHQPLRLERPPPDLVRVGLRVARDRRDDRDRRPGEGPAHRHLPLERGRRPARQRHRLRRPHHPPADRDRGRLPERAQPDPQPRGGDEDPEGAPLRAGAAEAAREAGRGGGGQEGHRLRQPDPLLRASPLPHGQGPPHQHETGNPDRVLDGDLDDFVKATLAAKARGTLGQAATGEE